MKNITKYLAVVAVISSLPLFSFASEGMGMVHPDLDLKADSGTVTSISGNIVTVTLSDATNIKVGDSITVFDRTFMENNRPVVGKVTATGTGTFTVQKPNGSTVTVNTSSVTIVKKDSQPADTGAITVGANVRVRGAWDSAKTTISASMVNIMTKLKEGLGKLFHHKVKGEVKSSVSAE